jgi:hypothetical protein
MDFFGFMTASFPMSDTFPDKEFPRGHDSLIIRDTENLDEKEVFVSFFDKEKEEYVFFLARDYQLDILNKICESSDERIPYDALTTSGFVQAKGFKYLSGNGPVIGYTNNREEEVYLIPMKIYANIVSRFEKGEDGRYTLYDTSDKIVESWPIPE